MSNQDPTLGPDITERLEAATANAAAQESTFADTTAEETLETSTSKKVGIDEPQGESSQAAVSRILTQEQYYEEEQKLLEPEESISELNEVVNRHNFTAYLQDAIYSHPYIFNPIKNNLNLVTMHRLDEELTEPIDQLTKQQKQINAATLRLNKISEKLKDFHIAITTMKTKEKILEDTTNELVHNQELIENIVESVMKSSQTMEHLQGLCRSIVGTADIKKEICEIAQEVVHQIIPEIISRTVKGKTELHLDADEPRKPLTRLIRHKDDDPSCTADNMDGTNAPRAGPSTNRAETASQVTTDKRRQETQTDIKDLYDSEQEIDEPEDKPKTKDTKSNKKALLARGINLEKLQKDRADSMEEILSVPDRFHKTCQFQNYRLLDRDPYYTPDAYRIQKKRLLDNKHLIQAFDGEDPTGILEFLHKFKEVCDDSVISEGHAAGLIALFLKKGATEVYQERYGALEDSHHTKAFYFEIVHHLIKTFADGPNLRDAEQRIRALKQQATQTAKSFKTILLNKLRKFGTSFTISESIQLFLDGLDTRIRQRVEHKWDELQKTIATTTGDQKTYARRNAFDEIARYADTLRNWESEPSTSPPPIERIRSRDRPRGRSVNAISRSPSPSLLSSSPEPISNVQGHTPFDNGRIWIPTGEVDINDRVAKYLNNSDACAFCRLPTKLTDGLVLPEDERPHVSSACPDLSSDPTKRYHQLKRRLDNMKNYKILRNPNRYNRPMDRTNRSPSPQGN